MTKQQLPINRRTFVKLLGKTLGAITLTSCAPSNPVQYDYHTGSDNIQFQPTTGVSGFNTIEEITSYSQHYKDFIRLKNASGASWLYNDTELNAPDIEGTYECWEKEYFPFKEEDFSFRGFIEFFNQRRGNISIHYNLPGNPDFNEERQIWSIGTPIIAGGGISPDWVSIYDIVREVSTSDIGDCNYDSIVNLTGERNAETGDLYLFSIVTPIANRRPSDCPVPSHGSLIWFRRK